MSEGYDALEKETCSDPATQSLECLRGEIDELDLRLTLTLIQRLRVAQRIGEYKRRHHLAITDKNRERERLEFVLQIAKDLDSQEFNTSLCAIYETIFQESKQIQKELLPQE